MLCTLCQTPVYHAEITYGPGRKPYHKPCLKCGGCGKRLEAGSLVEHNLEPFCKNCHLKSFGTKDLRHNNIPHAPAAISPSSSQTSFPPPSSPRYEPQPSASSSTPTRPPPPPTSYLSSPKPRPPPPSPSSKPPLPQRSYLPSSSSNGHLSSSSLQRSISSPSNSVPPPTPERSLASLAVSSRSASAYSPSPSKKPAFNATPTPKCPACQQSVYFAEQAIALDKKWHKACLRCSVCKKGLSQGTVQEHDGDIVCPPCYKKNYGPQGGGYALS